MTAVTLHLGDALDILPTLPAQSVNAIITDLPYGTTACKWDTVIPFAPMWEQVKRILKPRGVFVTTASQPFTSALVMSNLEWFKYEWILIKNRPSDKFNAKNKPLKGHENIVVFSGGTTANCSDNLMNYNPQDLIDCRIKVRGKTGQRHHGTRPSHKDSYVMLKTGYPDSVLYFPKDDIGAIHPTQKPTALYRYLILTYTNPGDVVLDFCAGSGTTGVAAIDTGRDCILIEREPEYHAIAQRRIAAAQLQPRLEGV